MTAAPTATIVCAVAALCWCAASCATPVSVGTPHTPGPERPAAVPAGDRGGCTLGDGLACERVGERYLAARSTGTIDWPWFAADRLLLRRACEERNVAGACTGLAWMMTPGERRQEVGALEHGCRLGSVRGCSSLAEHYASGDGIERDDRVAAQLHGSACEHGHAGSCGELGTLFAEGRGVPRDDVAAAHLHERACKAGALRACGGLGRAYARGRGVGRNDQLAVTLLAAGCQAPDPVACLDLAELLAAPGTTVRDEKVALDLATRTCDLGHAPACDAARRMRETASARAP